MTVEEVRRAVQDIADSKRDYEAAHGMEDDLWEAVLKTIAGGAPNARELAAEALKSRLVDFARYGA